MHFFKVILPSTLEDKKLMIPPNFVRKLGDELSTVVTLTVPNGRAWHVRLTKDENKIWFQDGWHDFVIYHSICAGHFLVFKYEKINSNFNVLIFDKSACEIEYPYHSRELDSDEQNSGHQDEDENSVEMDFTTPKSTFNSNKIDGSKRTYDVMVEEAASTIRKNKDHKKISENKGGSRKKSGGFEQSLVASKQIDVSKYIQPRNPHFFATLKTGSRKDLLLVPSQVLKQHKLDLPDQMIFENEHRSQWPGHTLHWSDGRTWINGWSAFCKWNNVRLDDYCLCELLPGCNERKGDILKVWIIRNAGSGS